MSWRKSNNTVDDSVLKVYVKSSEAPMSQDEYDAVERIKQSDEPTRPEKLAAIGLSLVEQSIMKYAGDSGIYLQPDEHPVLRTVKEHAIKENIDSYEFIEVSKAIRFDVDIIKQKVHIVGPHQLDVKERKLTVHCVRVGEDST